MILFHNQIPDNANSATSIAPGTSIDYVNFVNEVLIQNPKPFNSFLITPEPIYSPINIAFENFLNGFNCGMKSFK